MFYLKGNFLKLKSLLGKQELNAKIENAPQGLELNHDLEIQETIKNIFFIQRENSSQN